METPTLPLPPLTNSRYTGKPCAKCGNTIRHKYSCACVACALKTARDRERNRTGRKKKHNPAASRAAALRLKAEVMTRYGGECACCGKSHLIFLTIDHIDGSGSQHRRGAGIKGGASTYHWLRKNGYPDGFRVLCFNCNFAIHHLGTCPCKETVS